MPNLLAKSPREASGRPMSDAELDSKVRELAAYGALLSTLPADRGGAGHRRRGRSDPIDAPDSTRMTGSNQPARGVRGRKRYRHGLGGDFALGFVDDSPLEGAVSSEPVSA
jgi:hypothetical protein